MYARENNSNLEDRLLILEVKSDLDVEENSASDSVEKH